MDVTDHSFALFADFQLIGRGPLRQLARIAIPMVKQGDTRSVALFDERTGRRLHLDWSGSEEAALARLESQSSVEAEDPPSPQRPRGPGRPRLGVVSREVSLLPSHWSWLAGQRGGASATLRRLVSAARKANAAEDATQAAINAAHAFLWDLAGNERGFEEATRALFAKDFEAFDERISSWPGDVQAQVQRMLAPARSQR